jgi:hypothetical protein
MAAPFDLRTALSGRSGGVNRKTAFKMSRTPEKSTFCCGSGAGLRNFRKSTLPDALVSATSAGSRRRDVK